MDGEINMDREQEALVRLAKALGTRKLQVGMRDAYPALVIDTRFPGVQLHVFVSCSGENFTWQRADNRHPVDDPTGAADKIAAYVRRWETAPGGAAR